jgi:alpha-D-ribose 1-methylphosphonate 5-triphosphate synthase subunit PhnH
MSALTPGFAHAGEAQICFRAVLRALSRPGEIVTIDTNLTPPAPLSVAAASVLLTLADAATAVSVEAPARDWLLFHTGARLAGDAVADFVATRARPKLHSLRAGTDDEPEAGATLILDVEAFDGPVYRLTGPGMAEAATVRLPLERKFLEEWWAQRAIAPRGVDMLLCAGRQILGLPRSVAIEAA